MKKLYLLIVLIFAISCNSDEFSDGETIFNISTPILGITSTSVLLLWDDTFTPNYTSNDITKSSKTYYIFQNNIPNVQTLTGVYTQLGKIWGILHSVNINNLVIRVEAILHL